MAAITQITQLYGVGSTAINLATHLEQAIELSSGLHTLYLTAVKGTVQSSDTIDLNKVAKVVLEFTLDSGVSNKTVTFRRFVLSLDSNKLSAYDSADIVACEQLLNLPSKFYIRAVAIVLKDGTELKTGELGSLNIYINPLDLGTN